MGISAQRRAVVEVKTWKKMELIKRSIARAHAFGRVMNEPMGFVPLRQVK
jgi:hypothetical protein